MYMLSFNFKIDYKRNNENVSFPVKTTAKAKAKTNKCTNSHDVEARQRQTGENIHDSIFI